MSVVADPDRHQIADSTLPFRHNPGDLPANTTGALSSEAPEVVMIDPMRVIVPPRLRPEDPAHTAALVPSVRQHGVRMPIEVRLRDDAAVLIAGLHRLRAAIAAELKLIPAIVKNVDDDEAELLEIEENLIRHDLNPLDRAVFLARWKAVYDRLYPHAGKRGRKLSQGGTISFIRSDEAKKAGLSKSSIHRAVQRVGAIAEDVLPHLAGTDAALKGIVLDALSRLSHADQRMILALHEHNGMSFAAAIRLHKQRSAAPEDAQTAENRAFAGLLAAWAKHTNAGGRRRFLAELAEHDDLAALLPTGWGKVPSTSPRPASPKAERERNARAEKARESVA